MEPYRRLVETSPDGILLVEKDRITFANPSAVALCGAVTMDELVGRGVSELFRTDQHQNLRNHTNSCLAGEKAPPLDLSLIRRDGTVGYVSVAAALVTDEGASTIQLIVRDITAQKNAERALRESEERLT